MTHLDLAKPERSALPGRRRPDRGLRVAMVSEHASPLAALGGVDAGGQNVHVAALAEGLARAGCRVTVHTRRSEPGQGRVSVGGFVVDHVPAGPPVEVGRDEMWPLMDELAEELHRRWRRRPPDVVHAHFWMSGHAALRAAQPLGIPVVQTFHALGVVKRRHQGAADTSPTERCAVERSVLQRVTRVVATCSDEVAELVAMGGCAERMQVVPCGVDTARFTPRGPVAGGDGAPRLLAVGRLVPRKGFDAVIRALAALPGVHLDIAGGPPAAALDADPEARRLRAVAESAGVAGRVRLLGRLDQEQLPARYRAARAVVCAPWYEPFGIVPLEAMACGTPVVATAVGGLTDTVVEGRTGVLVPPGDEWALVDALRRLLSDEPRRLAMGRASRRRAVARYRWDEVCAATLAGYADVVASADVALTGVGATS